MLIRFTGPKLRRRLFEGYEFSRWTGFTQEVAASAAALMLTDPGGEFEVDPQEPLLQIKGIGPGTVGELALLGIGDVAALAALDTSGKRTAGKDLAVGYKKVAGWVEAAQAMIDDGADQVELDRALDDYNGCCG